MVAVLDSAVFNKDYFEAALHDPDKTPLSVYKEALSSAQTELANRFKAGRSATELVYARSMLIDEILQHAWADFFDPKDKNILLCAVGGYGRGELHPHSDVDLMILIKKSDAPYRGAIVAFSTFLWDIGLEVGHSVRTLKECYQEAKNDITIVTNVQESRLLIGSESLFESSRAKCAANKIWPSKDFFQAKWDEQVKRHLKFNDTAYNLEPNIKEGPGGLRDIQNIGWIAKRHFGADKLHDLVSHNFLTEQEYKMLHEGQSFLWQIRFGLHTLTGRREDRLLFDHQRSLASMFGYQDDHNSQAVEKLMKKYYRTIMELSRLNQMLLQLFQEEIIFEKKTNKPEKINSRFQSHKGFLEVTDENVFKRYPFALLEVFLLMTQNPKLIDVRANTVRLIREHSYLIDDDFRNDIRSKSIFMEILRQPYGVTHELRRMNLYGILAAYIPLFSNIVGQMQHDLFHIYTVDEHTLMVIRNLRRFTVEDFSDEFPLCSEVIKLIPKQELLLLAAMFHDIAKGRGGKHSELGATDAYEFCQHMGLSKYDSKLVSWLVLNHLVMSSTAQKKDISDVDVINDFACDVGDIHRLNYIYLLTVADIRATGPTVWNDWKNKLLQSLYYSARTAIRRGLDNPILDSEYVNDSKNDALKIINQYCENKGNTSELIFELWKEFDNDYFKRYSAEEIAQHSIQIVKNQKENIDPPYVLIAHNNKSSGYEIFFYSKEYQGMFAHITGLLEQQGFSIIDARILTSKSGYALDTYVALKENNIDDAKTDQKDIERITSQLEAQIRAKLKDPGAEQTKPNNALSRQMKAFKIKSIVEFWSDKDNKYSAMQVTTQDRPGILHRIGLALNDSNIKLHNAKIATYGERAQDIFYFTDQDGTAITAEATLGELRANIIKNLDG